MDGIREVDAGVLLDEQISKRHQIAVWWASVDVVTSAAAATKYPHSVEWLDIEQPEECDGQVRFVAGGRRFESMPTIVLRVKPGVAR